MVNFARYTYPLFFPFLLAALLRSFGACARHLNTVPAPAPTPAPTTIPIPIPRKALETPKNLADLSRLKSRLRSGQSTLYTLHIYFLRARDLPNDFLYMD
ncbi:uncharacterized protein EAE98_011712 [Botrytis deweyae]|uniref:Uncharacterized protein n=1 Tax=Botrytis deweyae TaxID=2478750 RepID=A0ABQ7I5B8_9HELO|nr:uncharacterized protein EAE98_011712 [Botrytis deweyae]KAF7913162.1 hypothetical protein EAE98_011712 [Botrytis deweyae]